MASARRKGITPPSFCHHVPHVFDMRSEPQMLRIDTRGIVACMEALKAVWDCAIAKFITKTMGADTCVFESQCPVSIFAQIPDPKPALVGTSFVYLTPEALFWRESRKNAKVDVMPTNETRRLTLDMTKLSIGFLGDWGGLTASTFTVFDFIKGKFGLERGCAMLHGIDFLLTGIGQARGVLKTSPGTLHWCFNYSTGV